MVTMRKPSASSSLTELPEGAGGPDGRGAPGARREGRAGAGPEGGAALSAPPAPGGGASGLRDSYKKPRSGSPNPQLPPAAGARPVS